MKFKEFLTEALNQSSEREDYDSEVRVIYQKTANELHITLADNSSRPNAPRGIRVTLNKDSAKTLIRDKDTLAAWITENLMIKAPPLSTKQESQLFDDLLDIIQKFAAE